MLAGSDRWAQLLLHLTHFVSQTTNPLPNTLAPREIRLINNSNHTAHKNHYSYSLSSCPLTWVRVALSSASWSEMCFSPSEHHKSVEGVALPRFEHTSRTPPHCETHDGSAGSQALMSPEDQGGARTQLSATQLWGGSPPPLRTSCNVCATRAPLALVTE